MKNSALMKTGQQVRQMVIRALPLQDLPKAQARQTVQIHQTAQMITHRAWE
jgi:hypothetical protein